MNDYKFHIGTDDRVDIEDPEGNRYPFELALILPVDGQDYAVLFPRYSEAPELEWEENAFLIVKTTVDEDGLDNLEEIEDDKEFERVVAAWEDLIEDETSGKGPSPSKG